ncbi:hypothetical protein CSW15_06505 [Thermus scotoductus]|uniref:SHOCT-like domain-containing protein n=1 Tax=Thermus scotoductus TaxID=37636 RepID=UPI000F7FD2FE|nr:hypothetical protein [Thermus scotoductus]RTI40890.1 hypothetical protein CSW15_06505 [Thermus scotoductus]
MEDKRRILEMVREGVLTPEEALELLSVLEGRDLAGGERPPVEASQVFDPQGFRVQVQAFGASLEVVSYTHLTLPTKREVLISVFPVTLKKKEMRLPDDLHTLQSMKSNVMSNI